MGGWDCLGWAGLGQEEEEEGRVRVGMRRVRGEARVVRMGGVRRR